MPARAWLWAFGAALAVELLAVAFGWDGVRWVSKGALTLLLLGYLRSALAPGQTVARLFAAGLLFACAADLALLVEGTPAFLTGMGLFAVMQVLYIAAFVKLGAIHAFDSGRVVLISYFAFWAGLITALWTQLGPLAVPVAVYSLLLVAMAALAGVLGFWNTLKHPSAGAACCSSSPTRSWAWASPGTTSPARDSPSCRPTGSRSSC
nr:hypothetical protein GCM10025732_16530 [Glycomyces mayteni]